MCVRTHGRWVPSVVAWVPCDPCWPRVKSGGRSDRISRLRCHAGNGMSLYKLMNEKVEPSVLANEVSCRW